MKLKNLSPENDVATKRMLLHGCQMGLKNPNIFSTARCKLQKPWFTESRSLREMLATLLDWPEPKTSDSEYTMIVNIRRLYANLQGSKPLENKRDKEAPEWTVLSSRAPRYNFYTAWSRAGLGLGNIQNPYELYNLAYVLVMDLSMFLSYHGAHILPFISEEKICPNKYSHSVQSNTSLFLSCLGGNLNNLGNMASIATDDTIRLGVYTAYMNVISETAWQGVFPKTDNTERKLKWQSCINQPPVILNHITKCLSKPGMSLLEVLKKHEILWLWKDILEWQSRQEWHFQKLSRWYHDIHPKSDRASSLRCHDEPAPCWWADSAGITRRDPHTWGVRMSVYEGTFLINR